MVYYDAHCHLMEDSVFFKATENGIKSFIVNTTKPDEWEQVADLNKRVLGIHFCAGIHPWFINNLSKDWEIQMELFLQKYPQAMIGEIGLDANRPFLDQQHVIFQKCLTLAEKYDRKVHIHCVGAWDEMISCLTQYRAIKPLFHRFNGNEVIIQKLRLFNAYFSVLNGRFLHMIPYNRLLVESDSPDGLKSPTAIPELVQKLNLNLEQINENFTRFVYET